MIQSSFILLECFNQIALLADSFIKNGKKTDYLFLLRITRKIDFACQYSFIIYLHVMFSTYVDERFEIFIKP